MKKRLAHILVVVCLAGLRFAQWIDPENVQLKTEILNK